MKSINSVIILIILVVASVLRFYKFSEVPFTHDEFSALFRTYFDSFSELIKYGVLTDTHPAGIQIFYFYWTKIFGYSEMVVKLPFIIAGLASIYLIFKISESWFNSTVGLISAAFMATIEYHIMYSQIARPYISGLFFCLLMVYYWDKVIFTENDRNYKNTIFYIIASALCAYNHHFSLLFAAIVGITGVCFVKKIHLIKYMLAGVSIFILYIPHLPIFFHQLKEGGIEGWLGKPHNDFLIVYIQYIFHYSIFVLLAVLFIILYGIINKKRINVFKNKFFYISLSWFFLPFLIGFFYSRYVNGVIQYSVLIFSFPFLLFILFGHLTHFKNKILIAIISIIMIINILTLIYVRNYYELFYNSPYEKLTIKTYSFKKKYAQESTTSILNTHKKISEYYKQKYKLDFDVVQYESFLNVKDFIIFLKNQKSSYFSYCTISENNPVIPFIISDYYPYLIDYMDYHDGNFYVYSKDKAETLIHPYTFESSNNFENDYNHWSNINEKCIIDSLCKSGEYSYLMKKNQEWGPKFDCKLYDIINVKNDLIDISVDIYPLDFVREDILIISSLSSKGKVIDWRAANFEDYVLSDTAEWTKIYYSVKLSDIYLKYPDIDCSIYIWNKNKLNFLVDDFNIKTRKGNKIIYGLLKKM